MAPLRVKSAGPGRRRCLTSVYERAPASHGPSLLSLLSHVFLGCFFFFLHATRRQLLTHKIYGAPATGVCVRARVLTVW